MSAFKLIDSNELNSNSRWLLNSLISSEDEEGFEGYKTICLGDILSEKKETMNPQDFPDDRLSYLGLENVQSFTGFLMDFRPKFGREVKSRCKIFEEGDLLYARLRPSLNKSIIIGNEVQQGICSTEYLVFAIDTSKCLPHLLRYIISSVFVQRQIAKYIAGAALPRIQSNDFLSIKIPAIPRTQQIELNNYLKKIHQRYYNYYIKLNNYERSVNELLNESIQSKSLCEIKD